VTYKLHINRHCW